jgi:hypothetical protein
MRRVTISPKALLVTIILLMTAPCFMTQAAEPDSWQRSPSEDQIKNLVNLPAVPQIKIYEVAPTRVETALAWHLARVPFAVLTCKDANFLAGGHYLCDENAKPILTRAVYANGGTGNFTVRYDDRILFIHHGSLGSPGPLRNVPLIVSLPFVPTELFAWASSAL